MKIFITGQQGYIGSHVTALLKEAGHFVTGCDLGLFNSCEWSPCVPADRILNCDIRQLETKDLKGHDAVIHLAAISNDPMGELDAQITRSINYEGSIHVATLAKEVEIPRFLFAGSCSIYGRGKEGETLNESAPLKPLSVYAQSKIDAELAISQLADKDFSPTFLRNATAYGLSPMLRIDLVVNNLLASAFAYNEIRIMSDGSPWRPLIHCYDIARAFIAFLNAPRERVHNLKVNIGANSENYRVKDIATAVQQRLAEAKVIYTGENMLDPRDYRVNFNLLEEVLPDFKLHYNIESGIDELKRAFVQKGFSRTDFEGNRYVRLRSLQKQIHKLELYAGV